MHARIAAPCGLLAVCVLAGCSAGPLSENGDLGNGQFTYECLSPNDNACSGQNQQGAEQIPFPSSLALGSRFNVSFTADLSIHDVGNPLISAVSPDYLNSLGTGFVAQEAGFAGVYAASSINGKLIDYELIRVVAPVALQVMTDSGPVSTQLPLAVNNTLSVSILPLGEGGSAIAGTLDGVWSTSDATVASLKEPNPSNTMQILGVKAGTATITVASSGPAKAVQTSITVQVN